MQVSIETTSGLERRLTITVPSNDVDSKVNAKLQEYAPNVQLNGFRNGKVPFKVIKQRYGKGVRQEVLGEVMSQSFYEAVTENKLKPAGQPEVDAKVDKEGKDLEFTATFEVYPELTVGGTDKLEITKPVASIETADVDNMIDMLRKQQAGWAEANKAAALEDRVNIDFEGFKDGEAFDGGKGEGTDLVLGSGQMIPGFEDGLVGAKAGEEKTLELTFPEEYHAEELKGAAVEFKVKVNKVEEQELPELNAELFQKFGVKAENEEDFRAEVTTNMERELKQAAANKVKNQVMDGLLAQNEVQVPKALVTNEIQALKQQALQQFGGMQSGLDASFLPDDMFTEQAEKRVALGLLLQAYTEAESIEADSAKVDAKIEEMASTYEDPKEVIEYYASNEQAKQSVESLVLEDMIIEKILESATVTEETSSYEEVMKPDAPAEAEA